jgi:hypothetical protein
MQMKKRIMSVALACMAWAAGAQDAPKSYALEGGSFAVGISANPLLRYFGNMFNGNLNNQAPTFGENGQLQGVNGGAIFGKYMLSESSAIRARLLFDFSKTTYKATVDDDYSTTVAPVTPLATTVDTRQKGVVAMGLSVGYERRKGTGRVQGFYGAELGLGFDRENNTYEWGNPMTNGNVAPSSSPTFLVEGGGTAAHRQLETKSGLAFNFGVNGFVGAEVFLVPGVALGGEVTLGIGASTRGQGETTFQEVRNGEVVEDGQRTRNANDVASSFGLTTQVGGNLYLTFYF